VGSNKYFRDLVFDNLEPSPEWFIVPGIFIAGFDGVVAGDQDAFWSDGHAVAFPFCGKLVMVCPHFEFLSADHLGAKVLYDDCLLA